MTPNPQDILLKLQSEEKLFYWSLNTNTKELEFSKSFSSITGAKSLVFNLNSSIKNILPHNDILNFNNKLDATLINHNLPLEITVKIINKTLSAIPVQLTGSFISDNIISGIGVKITQLHQDLKNFTDKTPNISLDKVPIIICITNLEGIIQYVNPIMEKISGYSNQEIINQHSKIFNSGFQSKEFYQKMWDTIKAGKTWEGKFYNKTKDGIFYWEKATISPFYSEQNNIIGFIKAAEDITKQVQIQKQLIEERNLFLRGPVMIFKWSTKENWPVTYVSPNVKNILGYTAKEFTTGKIPFQSIIHPDDFDRIMHEIGLYRHDNKTSHFHQQYRLKTKSNSYRYFNDYTSIEKNEHNQVSYFNGYVIDITDSVKTQEALKENELKYRDVFQTAGVGIIYTNKQGEILDTNKKFDELVNKKPGELVGSLAMDLINSQLPKKSAIKMLPILFHILKGNRINPIEIEFGKGFYELQSDYNPELERNIGILRDITDKKVAEIKVQQSETKYKYLIDNMNEGLAITDKDEHLIFVNDAAKTILEISSPDEISSLRELATNASSDIIAQQEHLRQLGETSDYFTEIITKNNKRKQIEIKASPIIDNEGKYSGSFGLLRDITEQYKAEIELKSAYSQLKLINKKLQQHAEELEIAKKQAEEGEQLKSAFLANISHEIRTPMNGIVGFAQLCMNRGLTEEKRNNYLQIISSSTLQLEAVVMDIIDLSKIESGETKLKYKDFHLNEILKDVHKDISEKAQAKNLSLHWELENNAQELNSDPIRFHQVICLLLENAIKFTNEGHISINAKNDNHYIIIVINDTGIGIPEDMLEIIFEPFRQVEMALKRRFGGTGLGLSIARKLARMLNGDILVESILGKGSTFYFKHPL